MNHHPRWSLQDAKSRFSELVRRAGEEGPQHVTVHGREKVVVIATEEYARLNPSPPSVKSGRSLIDIMQDPRARGLKFGRDSVRSPIRDTANFDEMASDVPPRHKRHK